MSKRVARGLFTAVFVISGAHAGADIVVSNTNDSGLGSLRQAIVDANAIPGTDRIVFDIPVESCSAAGVCQIPVLSNLPVISDAVMIDGTTQPRFGTAPDNVCATSTSPSYMRIELAGDTFGIEHITLASEAPSTVRGLSIGGGEYGVDFRSGGWAYCNHLGVDGPGTSKVSINNAVCYHCYGTVNDGALVGTNGDGANDIAERNVIGGSFGINHNAGAGLTVAGNYIGLGADGLTPISVDTCIYARQSARDSTYGSNLDGKADELERNILGVCRTGLRLSASESGTGNTIAGNWIGLDASGTVLGTTVGIRLDFNTPAIRVAANRIEGATDAAILTEDSAILAAGSSGNCIAGNATGLRQTTLLEYDFTGNWWGDTSGPSGLGPGTGDAIEQPSGMPVTVDPWLTAAPDSCFRRQVYADSFEGEDL